MGRRNEVIGTVSISAVICVLIIMQTIDALAAAVAAEGMEIAITIAVVGMIEETIGDIEAQDTVIVMRSAASMVDVNVKIIHETLIATHLRGMIVMTAEAAAAAVEVEAAAAIMSAMTVVLVAILTEVIVKATVADLTKTAKTDILVDDLACNRVSLVLSGQRTDSEVALDAALALTLLSAASSPVDRQVKSAC